MTRQTYHCLCGFASDSPGTCEKCKTALHPKRRDNPLFDRGR